MNEINRKNIELDPIFREYFHGETWFTCPTCKGNFEFFQAHFNKDRCPHCEQLLNMR